MTMARQTLLLLLAFIVSSTVNAQLTIDATQTPLQLVQNILLGNGISASNITFNGGAPNQPNQQIGSFNSSNSNVGVPQGIILSSGAVVSAIGPNQWANASTNIGQVSNDPDLLVLSGGAAINDAAVLDFTFVPTGNSISFRFVFASEEYPGFVCGAFNDAFGFFLSGPGINGPFTNNARNLAVLPNSTTPVTINSVNSGLVGTDPLALAAAANCASIDPNWQANSIYYVNNGNNNNPDPTAMRYNGSTVALTATAQVQCGQQYRIKIAIGDAGDFSYDSTIFLEAGTFASPAAGVDIVPASPFTACLGTNNLMAAVQPSMTAPYTYAWETEGALLSTADLLPLVVDSARTYTLQVTDACGAIATDTILVAAQPILVDMPDDVVLPCNFSGSFGPALSGMGPGAYTYQWTVNDSLVGDQQGIVPVMTTTPQYHVFSATDQCGRMVVDSFLVSMVQYDPIALVTSPDTTVFCSGDETVIAVEQINGGQAPYTYSWSDTQGNVISTDSVLSVVVASDMVHIVSVTDVCGFIGQDTVITRVPVHAPLMVTIAGPGVICEEASTQLSAMVTGGSGIHTFQWPGSGSSSEALTVAPSDDTSYTVIVSDHCGYQANATMLVQIQRPILDITVFNVDEDEWSFRATSTPSPATYDWNFGDGAWSGSSTPVHAYTDLEHHIVELTITTEIGCPAMDTVHLKPMAHVYFPNAFTPNGDGINDTFAPVGHELTLLEFVIFDRWGAVIFENKGTTGLWDGRSADGQQAPTGVYVCQYRLAGEQLPVTAGMTHVTLLGGDDTF